MLLNDNQIRNLIEEYDIISPYDPSLIQPCSIDIRLGNQGAVYIGGYNETIDPFDRDTYGVHKFHIGDSYILDVGDFVLIDTVEVFDIPDFISARVDGRSSVGRLGIQVHSTAGFVDPGFKGKITLEISNVNRRPIVLKPGMTIAQMSFIKILPCGLDYSKKGGRYMGDMGVEASLYWK